MTNKLFEDAGCLFIPSFLDPTTVEIIANYFNNKINSGNWVEQEDSQGASRLHCYADPLVEALLEKCRPAVEEACGRELLCTYSYARVYTQNEQLRPHIDRHACEITVTVNVANVGESSPIWVVYKKDPEKHTLSPGDAVVFKGCEAYHWRAPLGEGQKTIQFMLHYVDKNGPHAEWQFDKRVGLGYIGNGDKDACRYT